MGNEVEVHDGEIPPAVNLRQKLVAVMADVFGVPKLGRNTQTGYDYQRGADIFPKVQRALIAHGIAFVAHELSVDFPPPHESKSGGVVFVAVVKMQYRFHDTTSDEVISGDGSGFAFNSSDKGLNVAKAAALKYFLKQTFLLAEKDDDSETATIEVSKPAGRLAIKSEQARPAPAAEKVEEDPDIGFQASSDAPIATEHEAEVARWCLDNRADFLAVFGESFGVASPAEMTDAQFDIWKNVRTVVLNSYKAKSGNPGSKDLQAAHEIVNRTSDAIRQQGDNKAP